MATNKDTKMITITSRGIVSTSRGRVVAPIRHPYRESVDQIFKMLSTNPAPTILEHLGNGRTIPLTLMNYDKDNELIKPEISQPFKGGSANNAEMNEDGEKEDSNPQQPQQSQQPVNQHQQQNKNNNQQKPNGHKNKNKGNKNNQQQNKNNLQQPQQPVLTDDTTPVEV